MAQYGQYGSAKYVSIPYTHANCSPAHSRVRYWDDRYQTDPEPFDWYVRYEHVRSKLELLMSPSDVILNIGCGNSNLTEDLYSDNYTSIANVDYSKVVIDQMSARHSDKNTLTWSVMDIKARLDFKDSTFDVVVDKGCLDSILCGESSTNNITNSIYEILRVLKEGGSFLMISHFPPDKWLPFLEGERYGWSVACSSIERPMVRGVNDDREGVSRDVSHQEDGEAGPPVPIPSGRQGYHYLYVCQRKRAFY